MSRNKNLWFLFLTSIFEFKSLPLGYQLADISPLSDGECSLVYAAQVALYLNLWVLTVFWAKKLGMGNATCTHNKFKSQKFIKLNWNQTEKETIEILFYNKNNLINGTKTSLLGG